MIGGPGAEERFIIDDFSTFERYWTDPRFRAYCDAEREAMRAQCHTTIDAGMGPLKAKQEQRWREEGQ